jgi:hypothetical protein
VFKSDFIARYEGRLSERDFIDIGITCYNNRRTLHMTLDKTLELEMLLDVFADLERHEYLKLPIFKDATASAIQILMLLLGSQDKQNYTICNLTDNEYWYDTYFYIIQRFFTAEGVREDLKTRYFTRSNLKKTIMTYNYEATYQTCWRDFRANAKLPLDTSSPVYREVEDTFRLFYKYLMRIFDEREFFLMPSAEILNIFKKK